MGLSVPLLGGSDQVLVTTVLCGAELAISHWQLLVEHPLTPTQEKNTSITAPGKTITL